MVNIDNYYQYYFVKDNNAYIIKQVYKDYGLFDIGILNYTYSNAQLYCGTIPKLLQEIRKRGYKAILKSDYDKMENCVHFSYTEQNFLNSVLKAIKDNPETTHYCKNICNSILRKI